MSDTKTCKACRSTIDARARRCPQCGEQVVGSAERAFQVVLAVCFGLALVVGGLLELWALVTKRCPAIVLGDLVLFVLFVLLFVYGK